MSGWIIDGRIPPRTECPYRSECPIASAGECRHRGIDHDVYFSCATARLFEIVKRDEHGR